MQLLQIKYECSVCGCRWEEVWDCTCDSECPDCGQRDIEAVNREEINSVRDNGECRDLEK